MGNVSKANMIQQLPQEVLSRIASTIYDAGGVDNVFLFGSYARGEATPKSDIDIFYVLEDCGHAEEMRRRSQILRSMVWLAKLGIPFDCVGNIRSRYNKRKQVAGTLEWNVAQEGIAL